MFLQTLGLPIIWGSLDFKFALKKPTQGWTITQGPLSRAHCFKLKKWMDGSKKETKTYEHSSWTRMNTHGHPWAPPARMSTHEQWAPMNSHEFLWMFLEASCVRIKNQLAIYMLNHMSHSFKLLCLVFVMQVFGVNCFFEDYFFVYVLCTVVLSCIGFAPQEAIHCCKTWFLTHITHIYMCV